MPPPELQRWGGSAGRHDLSSCLSRGEKSSSRRVPLPPDIAGGTHTSPEPPRVLLGPGQISAPSLCSPIAPFPVSTSAHQCGHTHPGRKGAQEATNESQASVPVGPQGEGAFRGTHQRAFEPGEAQGLLSSAGSFLEHPSHCRAGLQPRIPRLRGLGSVGMWEAEGGLLQPSAGFVLGQRRGGAVFQSQEGR